MIAQPTDTLSTTPRNGSLESMVNKFFRFSFIHSYGKKKNDAIVYLSSTRENEREKLERSLSSLDLRIHFSSKFPFTYRHNTYRTVYLRYPSNLIRPINQLITYDLSQRSNLSFSFLFLSFCTRQSAPMQVSVCHGTAIGPINDRLRSFRGDTAASDW